MWVPAGEHPGPSLLMCLGDCELEDLKPVVPASYLVQACSRRLSTLTNRHCEHAPEAFERCLPIGPGTRISLLPSEDRRVNQSAHTIRYMLLERERYSPRLGQDLYLSRWPLVLFSRLTHPRDSCSAASTETSGTASRCAESSVIIYEGSVDVLRRLLFRSLRRPLDSFSRN